MRFGQIEVPPPKRGSKYRGVAVCRISTEHQDEMSLDDQLALYREWLSACLDGEYELEVVASQGSGEILDRAEFIELSEKVELGDYDFVIAEDLGRIARRIQVMILCEAAEDSATRVIAINDRVDTLEEDSWRQNAFFATMRHESYNKDTSRRIQRSHRNRFANGDMVRQLLAGHIKPHPGATEAECSKDPTAEPVYDEWFTRLERGQTFAEIAMWLNSINFPTGPAARKSHWNGVLVRQTTFNPLLKGLREHNRKVSKRVNSTGKRKSVKAPDDMLMTRDAPHLAFIEPERYDRVVRLVQKRNEKYRKGIANAEEDSRNRGTRNDSRWPSQHVRCGICGRKYVLGGHGRKDRMMCDGARAYSCWNAMTIDQAEVAQAVAEEIHNRIESLSEFNSELINQVRAEAEARASQQNHRLVKLESERDKLMREVENLTSAIAGGVPSAAIMSRLQRSEATLLDLRCEIDDCRANSPEIVTIPDAAELRKLAGDEMRDLAVDSREFARLMRTAVSDFFVLPYRLIDGGSIMPRVIFQLDLGCIARNRVPGSLECMSLDCRVDLTQSPQRAAYREQVMRMRGDGMTERTIAESLNITQTAVQRAAKLHRDMDSMSVTDPWQAVRTDADARDCYQRIAHPRYRFDPLAGFTSKFPEGW